MPKIIGINEASARMSDITNESHMTKKDEQSTTASDRVYKLVRQDILECRWRAGQRLKIRDIAAELGVSPMPVRTAFRRLGEEGILIVEENRSALRDLLFSLKRDGHRIAAIGAPAKGMTLLNYCRIGTESIDFGLRSADVRDVPAAAEDIPIRVDRRIPGLVADGEGTA